MKAPLYDFSNTHVGEIDVPDALFARPWNPDLVHQALHVQRMNARRPLAHTKGRGEVSGGGRKPWRQKGTGRARQGSIRSPLWRGGGVAHGPTNEKQFARSLPKAMRAAAISCTLAQKLRERELKFVAEFPRELGKTRELALALRTFGAHSFLLVPSRGHALLYRAARNLPRVKALDPQALNVHDLLRCKEILFEQGALAALAPRTRT